MNRKEKFEDLQLDFYRSFLPNGEAKYSKMLSKNDRLLLGLQEGVVLKRIDERHKTYLEYHNDRCFFE